MSSNVSNVLESKDIMGGIADMASEMSDVCSDSSDDIFDSSDDDECTKKPRDVAGENEGMVHRMTTAISKMMRGESSGMRGGIFETVASKMLEKRGSDAYDDGLDDSSNCSSNNSSEEGIASIMCGAPCYKHKSTTDTKKQRDIASAAATLEREQLKLREEKLQFEKTVSDQLENNEEYLAKKLAVENLALDNQKLQAEFNARCLANAAVSDECCICMDAPKDTVLVPCGHKSCCYACVEKHCKGKANNVCPICKAEVATFVKVFE